MVCFLLYLKEKKIRGNARGHPVGRCGCVSGAVCADGNGGVAFEQEQDALLQWSSIHHPRGDLQARFVALSLLNLVLDSDSGRMESVRDDLFKRHSDYNIMVGEIGMKLDFIWSPYETNLTDLVIEFKRKRKYPDVLMMGTGLWHILHVNNATDYCLHLLELRSSVESLLPFSSELATDGPVTGSGSIRSPHLFWVGMPMLINGMLNTEEKKEKMSDAMWHAYDRALGDSRLLRQTGGPLVLLDIQSLTWNCGPRCTVDGMHYDGAIYEAVIHIMLNALLIESHQTL